MKNMMLYNAQWLLETVAIFIYDTSLMAVVKYIEESTWKKNMNQQIKSNKTAGRWLYFDEEQLIKPHPTYFGLLLDAQA